MFWAVDVDEDDDCWQTNTAGAAADMVLTRARSMTELLSRPQSERTVLVAGRAIDTTLPDYAELDTILTA